jgi:hypothetical protein
MCYLTKCDNFRTSYNLGNFGIFVPRTISEFSYLVQSLKSGAAAEGQASLPPGPARRPRVSQDGVSPSRPETETARRRPGR